MLNFNVVIHKLFLIKTSQKSKKFKIMYWNKLEAKQISYSTNGIEASL